MFTDAEIRAFAGDDTLRASLRRGEVDFIFGDAIALAFWINGTDSGDCCAFSGGPFVESRYFGEGIGIGVRKGNDLLRQALNWALFRVWEKGRTICGCAISRSARSEAPSDVIARSGKRRSSTSLPGEIRKLDCFASPAMTILLTPRPVSARKSRLDMSTTELTTMSNDLRALAEQSNAWPFEQAKAIVARLKKKPKDEVLFETGYGPSGLPHIGTFGEVARTSMVRHAFRLLTQDNITTRLLAFSDDMDGLRKVPDNVPNKEMMTSHLGKPLTRVPDPFSNEYPSFGAANNARLRAFLDRFGFAYEFASTDYYTSGRFDATLRRMLAVYDEVMEIILPTLGPERRATYSPFLPISRTGIVLQVPMVGRDVAGGSIAYGIPTRMRSSGRR